MVVADAVRAVARMARRVSCIVVVFLGVRIERKRGDRWGFIYPASLAREVGIFNSGVMMGSVDTGRPQMLRSYSVF